jgi:hypothetical protein
MRGAASSTRPREPLVFGTQSREGDDSESDDAALSLKKEDGVWRPPHPRASPNQHGRAGLRVAGAPVHERERCGGAPPRQLAPSRRGRHGSGARARRAEEPPAAIIACPRHHASTGRLAHGRASTATRAAERMDHRSEVQQRRRLQCPGMSTGGDGQWPFCASAIMEEGECEKIQPASFLSAEEGARALDAWVASMSERAACFRALSEHGTACASSPHAHQRPSWGASTWGPGQLQRGNGAEAEQPMAAECTAAARGGRANHAAAPVDIAAAVRRSPAAATERGSKADCAVRWRALQ